jgi:predicted RNA-binding Zn-ribbon protein involved in translation (DUF1610 family)
VMSLWGATRAVLIARLTRWREGKGSTMYHCDACGWDGDTPVLADDPLGDFIFTLRVCPDCGEEVYETPILREPTEDA